MTEDAQYEADRALAARARSAAPTRPRACVNCLATDTQLDRRMRCVDRDACEERQPPLFPADTGQ